MGQGFTHPSRAYRLYEKVRSAAVHGSEPPDVSEADVHLFAGDVRVAIEEYLRYGQEQGFTRQSQLVAALDSHPDRPIKHQVGSCVDSHQETSAIMDAALGQVPRMCLRRGGFDERPGSYPDAYVRAAVRRELLNSLHRAAGAPARRRR
jgi:hypothetical protein